MPLLLGLGEEIDFSCVFVVETVFFISSIDIVFIVVMVMYQNRQVMLTSFGFC